MLILTILLCISVLTMSLTTDREYAYDQKYNSYINAQNTFAQENQIGGFDSISYMDTSGI